MKDNIIEIAPGSTIEEMKALFFDQDALTEQPVQLYRLDLAGKRFYYSFTPEGKPIFYTSVTTLISQTLPKSPHLIKWVADMGYDESKRFMEEMGSYGTFMHIEITQFLISRKCNLDSMGERLLEYMENERLPLSFSNHLEELKKDLMSFAQFVIDFKVKPLAIEISLAHPTAGYAGALDLPCMMTLQEPGEWGEVFKSGARKGLPKVTKKEIEVVAIVDFKRGRKGFYEDNELQLEAYKNIWNWNFPSLQVRRIFNWSPKDWRGETPTYNLKDQSYSPNLAKLPLLVDLARIENMKARNKISIIEGVIDLDNPDLEKNIRTVSRDELVTVKNEKPKKEKNDKSRKGN